MREAEVIVIGGGMVGSAAAYGLARRGVKPLVLDGGDLDYRAARGNGGRILVQGKGLRMPAYQHLTRRSSDMWPEFVRELGGLTGIDMAYQRKGLLTMCLGEEELAKRESMLTSLHDQPGASERDFEMLDRAALERLTPGIPYGPDVTGASYCWRDGHVDPLRLLESMQRGIKMLGGVILGQRPARAITKTNGVFSVETDKGVVRAPRILIAAGNDSEPLARQVDVHVSIRPQRGQVIMTERIAPVLPIPIGALRQTADGTIQIGSTQEGFGFDISTTVDAAVTLARRAVRVIPMLAGVRVIRQWAALRVMTPDTYPVYAESPTYPGAFVALCHSAITLAAVHAELLGAALATGRLPDDASPFHHRRFDVQKTA